MKFINGNLTGLLQAAKGKKLVVCGESADKTAETYINVLCEMCPALCERIDCIIWDTVQNNAPMALGSNKIEKPLFTYENFLQKLPCGDDFVMLFADTDSLARFFDTNTLPEGVKFFSIDMLLRKTDYDLNERNKSDVPLIPKLLHYIWIGGGAMKPLHHKCIASWRKFCPDYEIIRWDENSYDFTKHPYMHEAYKAGKYAFAPDYARLDILYHYGGIYLDTDVEIIKPLDDFLFDTGFCGVESPCLVAAGLILGAVKHHPMLKALRDYYDDVPFIKADGTYDLTPSPIIQSRILNRFDFKHTGKIEQIHGLTIYPMDVFAPIAPNLKFSAITERTHAMHHYDASWHDPISTKVKLASVRDTRRLLQEHCDEDLNFISPPPPPDSLIQQMPPEMWQLMPEAAEAIYSGKFEEAMTILDEYLAESLERGSAEDAEYILAAQLFTAALLGDESLTRDIRTIRLELFSQTAQQEKARREYARLEKLCTAEELQTARELAGME